MIGMKLYTFLAVFVAFLVFSPDTAGATTVYVDGNGGAYSQMENPKPPIPAGHVYVPKDTRVKVYVPKDISSKSLKKNDYVILKLKESFIVNRRVIAPEGTNVFGAVLTAHPTWAYSRGQEVCIKMVGFGTYRSVLIPLHQILRYCGDSPKAASVRFGDVTVGGWVLRGNDAVIPAGTEYIMRVSEDTDLGVTVEDFRYLDIYSGVAWDDMESDVSLTGSVNPPAYAFQ